MVLTIKRLNQRARGLQTEDKQDISASCTEKMSGERKEEVSRM